MTIEASASASPATLFRTILITASALGFYFVTSIALTVFNKWLFAEVPKDPNAKKPLLVSKFGFHYPLTVTCLHQLLVFVIVVAVSKWPALTSRIGEVEKSSSAFWTLVPIGALCGIDWGLSNTSLRSIPLSLYEMVKSSSPVVVLLFSFRFGMVRVTNSLACIILLISVGTFLSVSGGDVSVFFSASFPLKGFIAVSVATLLSGTRVVLTQFALQKGGLDMILSSLQRKRSSTTSTLAPSSPVTLVPSSGSIPPPTPTDGSAPPTGILTPPPIGPLAPASTLNLNSTTHLQPPPPLPSAGNNAGGHGGGFNTMTALYYCAPASAASLVLPALIFEMSDVIHWCQHASPSYLSEISFWIVITSIIAFLLSVAEFTVTGLTSALTMCVTGIAKQVLIVGLAMVIFGDHLGVVNAVGFTMSIVGISLYNYLKYKQVLAPREQGYSGVPNDTRGGGGTMEVAGYGGAANTSMVNMSSSSPLTQIPIGHIGHTNVSMSSVTNSNNPSTTIIGGSPMTGASNNMNAAGNSLAINTMLSHHYNNISRSAGLEMQPIGSHHGSHRDSPVTQQANNLGKAVLRASISKNQ